MFMATHLVGFGAGGSSGPATISYTANPTAKTADASSFTFSTVDIGTDASDRIVVVGCYAARNSAGARNITAMTIGGVSASLVKQQNSSGGNTTEIWQASVPSGTTGDVVIDFSAAMTSVQIGVWAVYGAGSAAHDTGNSTADPMVDTINVPAGGVLIGVCGDEASNTTTWTGITENFDQSGDGAAKCSGASDAFATAQTGLSITADPSGAASDNAMVLASWGP